MMAKYIANPVEVDAFEITHVEPVVHTPRRVGIPLRLDDGTHVIASPEMTSRITPKVGDYWVVQSDGYIYLNPKDVFERKYHSA
jgi:hypothetical protein